MKKKKPSKKLISNVAAHWGRKGAKKRRPVTSAEARKAANARWKKHKIKKSCKKS